MISDIEIRLASDRSSQLTLPYPVPRRTTLVFSGLRVFSHRPQFPASHPRFLVRRRLLLFRIRLCRPQVLFLYRQFPVSHPQGKFFRRRFPVSRRQAGFHRRQSSALLRQADFLHRRSSALLLLTGFRRRRSSVSRRRADFLHWKLSLCSGKLGLTRLNRLSVRCNLLFPHQQAGLWQPQAEFLRLLIYCDSSQSELLRRQSLLWRMPSWASPSSICF